MDKAVSGLLSLFRRLSFSHRATNSGQADQDAFHRLNQLAPVERAGTHPVASGSPGDGSGAETSLALHASSAFLCRDPILNRDQRIVGYEFQLHSSRTRAVRAHGKRIERLRSEILLHNMARSNMNELLGHRLAFVPVPDWLLWSPLIRHLPREGCVLTIVSSGHVKLDTAMVAAQAENLRHAGHALALDGEWDEGLMNHLAARASYLVVNAAQQSPPDLRRKIRVMAKRFSSVTIIGKAIESFDDFEVCRSAGCGLFQGGFVTAREDWAGNRIKASTAQIFNVLNQLRQDADTAAIVKALKHDPILPYRLLRYVNSAAGGLLVKVSSIEQALILLGREKLYRWLTLVLFNSSRDRLGSAAILETALVRGRLMELLGQNRLPSEHSDQLFLTGLFSLLDKFLCVPLNTAVSQLSLPEAISQALLEREGPFAPYLELALACEGTDRDRLESLAQARGVGPEALSALQIDALLWAQQDENCAPL